MALITDPTSPLYNTQAGGLQPTQTNPVLKPGQYFNAFNKIVTPGVLTPPPSGTAVITSKPAAQDVNNIKTQADQMQQGITQQAKTKAQAAATQTVPPETYTMSFSDKAAKAAQYGMQNYTGTREQDLVLLTKMVEEKANLQNQLKNMQEGAGYLAEGGSAAEQYLAQNDPESLANFKKANPGLQFTDKDLQKYFSAGNKISDNLTIFQQSQNQRVNEVDTQIKNVNDTLSQFLNGTLPLTPDQQAQVEAMKQKAESIRQAQLLANKQYEGAVTRAGIRSGRNVYAPGIEAGNIQAAVSSGLAKLQDLDTQAADNLAKLQHGFRESNYKLIKDSWEAMGKLQEEKAKTIKDTYDAVAATEKEQTRILEKQKEDYYNQVTKPIQEIGLEAAKNAASPEVQAKIRSAKTVQEAIDAAGSSLMSATGDVGDYLGYKRMSEAQGLTPRSFDEWMKYKDQQEASRAYSVEYSKAAGKAAAEAKFGTGLAPEPIEIDANSNSLIAQTGLSFNAFMAGTGNLSSLPRDAATRNRATQEFQAWAIKNGIDTGTFVSRFKSLNEALSKNIARFNNTVNMEGELLGTIQNLEDTFASDDDFSKIRAANVAKIWAGQEVNDPIAQKYITHLTTLRDEYAGYNAALRGDSPLQSDIIAAEQVIKNGLAKGSLEGFKNAIIASTEKMDRILQNNVDRTGKQVWDLFGVGKNYKSVVAGDVNSQLIKEDKQAEQKVLDYSAKNPGDDSTIDKMVADGMSYADILNWINQKTTQ